MVVLDAFPANSEDPNIKISQGNMPPDPPKRLIKILSSPFPPPPSLGCYLVLASTRLPGFSPLHRLYSAILHHRNKHRLKLYPRTVKIRLKNVGKKKGNSWYQTYSQIWILYCVCELQTFKIESCFQLSIRFCSKFPVDDLDICTWNWEVHKHSMRTDKQQPRKWLVYEEQSSWGGDCTGNFGVH